MPERSLCYFFELLCLVHDFNDITPKNSTYAVAKLHAAEFCSEKQRHVLSGLAFS